MYDFYLANKNYSSWSLRPWILMRERNIPFQERLVPFADWSSYEKFKAFSPSGKVPCLVDQSTTVWDSLAIIEYLAEHHEGVWPAAAGARAWARSAAAEMHSGFGVLRDRCPMNCGIRVSLASFPEDLKRDLQRICELWEEGLTRFGGPFLAGKTFTAVDAFFVPIVVRADTYDLPLTEGAASYAARIRELASLKEWYEAALLEPWREPAHEEEVQRAGVCIEDRRAAVAAG